MTALGSAGDRLGDQGSLADAGLALDVEHGAGSFAEAVQQAVDDRELTVAPDHRPDRPLDAHHHQRTHEVAARTSGRRLGIAIG